MTKRIFQVTIQTVANNGHGWEGLDEEDVIYETESLPDATRRIGEEGARFPSVKDDETTVLLLSLRAIEKDGDEIIDNLTLLYMERGIDKQST